MLVTSVVHQDAATDSLQMLAISPGGAWSVTTPLLPISPNGAGDLTSALFLAHVLGGGDVAAALGRTASTVFTILEATAVAGETEIALVAGQEAIANPPLQFDVAQLR